MPRRESSSLAFSACLLQKKNSNPFSWIFSQKQPFALPLPQKTTLSLPSKAIHKYPFFTFIPSLLSACFQRIPLLKPDFLFQRPSKAKPKPYSRHKTGVLLRFLTITPFTIIHPNQNLVKHKKPRCKRGFYCADITCSSLPSRHRCSWEHRRQELRCHGWNRQVH